MTPPPGGLPGAVAESWPDPSAVVDAEGRVLWSNQRMRRFCPALAVAADGEAARLADILDDPAQEREVLRLGLSSSQPMPLRLRLRQGVLPDPDIPVVAGQHWRLTAARLPAMVLRLLDAESEASRFLELTRTLDRLNREVLARREAEGRLRLAVAEATRANRIKDRIIAEVSHDMRTPLNAIIGFAELMRMEVRGPLSADYAGYVGDILSSAGLLLEFVDEMLQASPERPDDSAVVDRAVELKQALDACLSAVLPLARRKGLELMIPPDVRLPRILAIRAHLSKILLNVLDNAVKFSPPGSQITIDASGTADGGLEIRISDTGPGIAAEELPYVTEPLFRSRSPHVAGTSGYGMGLAVAKRLTEQMGARLSIQSRPGQGTTVGIGLPPTLVSWAG